MQHSPVMQPGRRFDSAVLIGAILFLVTLLIVFAAIWLTARPATPATESPAAPAALSGPAQIGVMGYIHAHQALRAPAPVVIDRRMVTSDFADEAGYVATINEYLSSGLDNNYLPLSAITARADRRQAWAVAYIQAIQGGPTGARMLNRFFADELANTQQAMLDPPIVEPVTLLAGPR